MRDYSVRPNPDVPFDVRYEDAELLVVVKPAGVVTQPGLGHKRDSLLNGLFADHGDALQNLGESRGWGLLHRLDRPTSGLVIVALRVAAYENLLEQFKKRAVRKLYWAIVAGKPVPAQGVIQKPIAEVVSTRRKAVIRRDGQQAITAYKVLQTSAAAAGAPVVSLIEARPKTGRLHQIRVHMADAGHPILGEDEYAPGLKLPPAPRLCLHAAAVRFVHPTTRKPIVVQCDWPADLGGVLRRYGLTPPHHEP